MTLEAILDTVDNPLDKRFDEELEKSINDSRGYMSDRERSALDREKAEKAEANKPAEDPETPENTETPEVPEVPEEPETPEVPEETDEPTVDEAEQVVEDLMIDPENMTEEEQEKLAEKLFTGYQSKKDKLISDLQKEIANNKANPPQVAETPQPNNLIAPIIPVQPSEELGKEPPKPTEDDWDDDRADAMEKFYANKKWHEDKAAIAMQKKDNEIRNLKDLESKGVVWRDQYDSHYKLAADDYPDVRNPESELAKETNRILTRDPRRAQIIASGDGSRIPLLLDPHADGDAVRLAAQKLGIAPKGKKPQPKPASKVIYRLGSKAGSGKPAAKVEMTEDDLGKMSTYELGQILKLEAGII